MPRITKHVVIRLALLVIVFEFLFAPFLADDVKADSGNVTYDTRYNNIALPDFFKEQDEKGSEKCESFSTSVPILDLTYHNHRLESTYLYILHDAVFLTHTPKFKLFHSLLI